MDLLNYIKIHGDAHGGLATLPTGMNAVVPADPARGLPAGVIFSLRNRNNGVNINQQNRLHPFYLIYIGQNGEVIADHTEVKRLLDLVRSACKGHDKPVPEVCRLFSQATNDGRRMDVYSDLLGQAIRSMVDVKEERDIDSLFSAGKTTALVDTIAGLDDFELVAFIAVQDAG